MLDEDDEPTFLQLKDAFNNAILCQSVPDTKAQALQELKILRNLKYTWDGSAENNLRFAIDRFLNDESLNAS